MSRAASLPGAELVLKKYLKKPFVPGSFAAWGRLKKLLFLNKPLVLGSFAAWGRTSSPKNYFFEQATCPGQLRCLGQTSLKRTTFLTSHLSRAAPLPGAELFSKNDVFMKKPLVPGSFAAWGRTFLIFLFEQTTCPGQRRCLEQNFCSFCF